MAAYQYIYVMKNLTKSYPGGREILKGLYLSFLPGAKIGVLGANGAGKSTLLKIMPGSTRNMAERPGRRKGSRSAICRRSRNSTRPRMSLAM